MGNGGERMTKRFKEIISTQKIVDTVTNKEYDCLLDNDLFELINVIADENEQLQSEVSKLTDLIASEIEKNARLLQEINSLKIGNMRLKESIKDLNDVLARYEERELRE